MSDFSFTGTVECERCGAMLRESADDCDECADESLKRYRFGEIGGDSVEVVWSINPVRAWHDLAKSVENPIYWKWLDRDVTSAEAPVDVRDL